MPLFSKPNVDKLKEESDIDGLLAALGHRDSSIRQRAATALGELRDERATQPLIQALDDSDRQVRISAAQALSDLGSDEAVEPLLAMLDTSDTQTLVTVGRALEKQWRWRDNARVSEARAKAATVVKENRRTRASDWWVSVGLRSKKCDVCSNPVTAPAGFILDSYEMLSSPSYIQHATDLRMLREQSEMPAGSLNIPGLGGDIGKQMLSAVLTMKVVEDIRKVKTPWLVCDQCYQQHFSA